MALHDMLDERRVSPRQERFGCAHSRGFPCRQDDRGGGGTIGARQNSVSVVGVFGVGLGIGIRTRIGGYLSGIVRFGFDALSGIGRGFRKCVGSSDLDMFGRIDTNSNVISSNFLDQDFDVITNTDGFARSTRQD